MYIYIGSRCISFSCFPWKRFRKLTRKTLPYLRKATDKSIWVKNLTVRNRSWTGTNECRQSHAAEDPTGITQQKLMLWIYTIINYWPERDKGIGYFEKVAKRSEVGRTTPTSHPARPILKLSFLCLIGIFKLSSFRVFYHWELERKSLRGNQKCYEILDQSWEKERSLQAAYESRKWEKQLVVTSTLLAFSGKRVTESWSPTYSKVEEGSTWRVKKSRECGNNL